MNLPTHAFVTGATGFIGRFLVLELASRGDRVTALMRRPAEQLPALNAFLAQRGAPPIRAVRGDLSEPRLGLSEADWGSLSDLTHIYHLGAAMRWGMSLEEARAHNLNPLAPLLELAQTTSLRRFVPFGGFMRFSQEQRERYDLGTATDCDTYPWERLARRVGSYEASKLEFHFRMLRRLEELGVPYTALHPAAVVGHSETGELYSGDIQQMIKAIAERRVPAVPGRRDDIFPLIPVDFVAKFAALAADRQECICQEYILLDPASPKVRDLFGLIAGARGVAPPRMHVPKQLLRLVDRLGMGSFLPLPTEPLTFFTSERFDVRAMTDLAERMGVCLPPPEVYVSRMAQHAGASV